MQVLQQVQTEQGTNLAMFYDVGYSHAVGN
jgi:hypothetical protein